jgi:amino acid transporter
MRPRGEGRFRAAPLGPFLCWAVVFADIGTSVYYTPGILFNQVGAHAPLFVGLTLVAFMLLTGKYAEVAIRYPEGGGVVTVATRAIHPFAGLVGGLFILVDYFLTAALSALSGVIYMSVVAPQLKPVVVPLTLAALLLLGFLNWMGISSSAIVSAVFACAAAAGQLAVVAAVLVHVGVLHAFDKVPLLLSAPPRLTPVSVLTGYAGAFLAFSGLESIAQLAPAMAEPRRRVARRSMTAVVMTMVITSPLLTLWSTTLLDARHDDPNQFISILAGYAGGGWLQAAVAISGALLLVFASNTAIIGCYHVFCALGRMRFLPKGILHRNSWRNTPQVAIALAVLVPLAVVVAANGSTTILGDLYAFGLLGAFSVTCVALDIVRWHERRHDLRSIGSSPASLRVISRFGFLLGVVTTAAVLLAWTTNLWAKPMATLFGGGITVLGLLVAFVTYRYEHRREPIIFPHLHSPHHPTVLISKARRMRPASVLVLLPDDLDATQALVRAGITRANGRPIVFLYRGTQPITRKPGLFEVIDPYLDDQPAQAVFARAERTARQARTDSRFVYVASNADPDAVPSVWRSLHPQETLLVEENGDAHGLTDVIPADHVTRTRDDGVPILHYVR